MLLGRHDECRQLESLLDDARRGTSRTVIVRGDGGMGKSALLAFVASRADDFEVHAATGVESEADLPYGALLAICRPLLPFLDRLSQAQRGALETALAINPGLVPDRFTAYAGALTLIAAAAEVRPQLILVDDLQWLDTPSAEALLFVARRLDQDRVAIVTTARAGEDESIDFRGLSVMDLAGLEIDASRELLRRRYGAEELPDDVANRLARLTGGAPLALVEIPGELSSAQIRGEEALPDPLPVSDAIRRAFRREIESLPHATIEALILLAAEDRGSLAVVARALAAQGASIDVLIPAERAHLISIADGEGLFRHPLLRSAVYHLAEPSERRAAHRSLAEACGSDDRERCTWHAATAAVEPDETLASALVASADASRSRSAFASAARALERAAQLTSHADLRAMRLLSAAENAWRAGDPDRTQRLLNSTLDLTLDPVLRADVLLLRGRFFYAHGSATDAYEMLLAGASAIESIAPDRAALLLLQAAWVCLGAAELQSGLDAAWRASAITRGLNDDIERAALHVTAEALVLVGRMRDAVPMLERWKDEVDVDDYSLAMQFNPTTALVYLSAEDYAFARRLIGAFHSAARSAPEALPLVLACLTQFEYRTGDWEAAYAHGVEGVHLSAAFRQHSDKGFILANLAVVAAALGRGEARDHAREVYEIAARSGLRSLRTYGHAAVGLLELGAGRIESAIHELEEVDRMMRDWGVGDPSVVQWMPDLIEAYVRAGRRQEAEALLETLSTQAEKTDGNWARAAAARCAGMLDDSFDEHFIRALSLHAAMPTPFDQARTQLCYGERLRRAGRRRDARAQLRAALVTFERLRASDWRGRAAAELGVSAERLASRDIAMDRLSPQELQVSLLVAEGATNREAAAALFVTAKTVEFHLRNVYRKLGIRSRTELARLVTARRGAVADQPEMPITASA
jgi:DNA-binding CsgD family transcriptional regulator